jgi:hypothetical protein
MDVDNPRLNLGAWSFKNNAKIGDKDYGSFHVLIVQSYPNSLSKGNIKGHARRRATDPARQIGRTAAVRSMHRTHGNHLSGMSLSPLL